MKCDFPTALPLSAMDSSVKTPPISHTLLSFPTSSPLSISPPDLSTNYPGECLTVCIVVGCSNSGGVSGACMLKKLPNLNRKHLEGSPPSLLALAVVLVRKKPHLSRTCQSQNKKRKSKSGNFLCFSSDNLFGRARLRTISRGWGT